jgi:parallel beta-helix repeat protein
MKFFVNVFAKLAAALSTVLLFSTAANAATINLSPGGNLNLAIEQAAVGDTILLAPGTYTPQTTPYIASAFLAQAFWITKNITIRSTGGAAATILSSNGGYEYAVQFRPINYLANNTSNISNPSGAVLEGVTINSARGGIAIFDPANDLPSPIRNIQIRNSIVNADSDNVNNEHAVLLQAVQDCVIDGVIVNKGAASNFYVVGGTRNTLMNSTANFVRNNHPVVFIDTTHASVLNNVVNQAKLEGIVLKNTQYSRVEGNTVSGYISDGITLTNNSSFNAVVHNSMVSDAYRFSPSVEANILPGRTHGVGMWLNCGSNGNYVSGNFMRGAPEVGLAVYSSSNNYLLGNTVTENFQAGILTKASSDFCFDGITYPVPSFNALHRNIAVYQEAGSGIFGLDSNRNEVAFNYISTINQAGAKLFWKDGTGGIGFLRAPNNLVFANTVFDTTYAAFNFDGSSNTPYFRNRFLKTQRFELRTSSGVVLDDNLTVGGNHWDGHATSGNPDPNRTPYTGVTVFDAAKNLIPTGDNIDRFTYDSETFGRAYDAVVKFPAAGAVVAAGRRARIEWHSDACAFVNIIYNAGGPSAIVLATKVPNTGYYIWNVPALTPASNYIAGVECLTSSGAGTGVFRYSQPFTIANNSLILLAPHNGHQGDAGTTLRVVWRKTDPNAAVNVFLSHSGGAETLLASNITASFADVTLPAGVSSNTARIRISSATGQDGTDGYFSIRTTTGAVNSVVTDQNIRIGYVHDIRWNSVVGSTTVDLSFWDGAAYRNIIQNLPDRGSYAWFVREVAQSGSVIRVTYKNAAGATISVVNSPFMNIVYRTDTGVEQQRYRLFNKITNAHLYTSDRNEYDVLRVITDRWADDFPAPTFAMKTHSGPATIGGIKLQPYYRLLNKTTVNHYWTITRDDYLTKRADTATWQQEGVDGYIFPSQVSGTVPLYRMFSPPLNKYLWTVDANEFTVLTTQRGWQAAGVAGLPPGVEAYVLPPPPR